MLGEYFGLLQVRSPLLSALSNLAELELVGNVLDLKLPLLLANVRLDDGILCVLSLHVLSSLEPLEMNSNGLQCVPGADRRALIATVLIVGSFVPFVHSAPRLDSLETAP